MKKLTAKDTLELISKQWCSSQDFSILSNTGKNTTLKLMRELRKQLEQENYFLPTNLLPMDKVVEHLGLNIPYLKNVSNFEGNSTELQKPLPEVERSEDLWKLHLKISEQLNVYL